MEISCANCKEVFKEQEDYANHLLEKHPEDTTGCAWANEVLSNGESPKEPLKSIPPDKIIPGLITSVEKSREELLNLEDHLVQDETLLLSRITENRDLLKTLDKVLELLTEVPQ